MIVLNLLPFEDKNKIIKNYLFLLIKDVIFSLLLLSSILGIIFLISHFILIKNFIEISNSSLPVVKSNAMTEEVRKINRNLSNIKEIQDNYVNWVKIILDINNLIPQEKIQITNLETNLSKNSIILQGKAADRDGFLKLKDNLEKTNLFKNIKSPLTNLLLAEKINFQLEMEIQPIYVEQ